MFEELELNADDNNSDIRNEEDQRVKSKKK